MGQSAHPALPRRAGALTIAVALGAMTLTGCGSSVAAATTTLARADGVLVVHPDGTTTAGVAGMHLSPGDVVRTGPRGVADLVTRSRHVYLGSAASLQVLDGARESLRHGAAVVDAQHGPGLQLDVGGLTVSSPGGSAVRVERSATTRVGSLAGSTSVVSVAGRSLTLPALRQVVTGGDALPDQTAPLRLTDDDAEARTVPDLVRADETLLGLARGIDGSTGAARVVTASWQAPLASTPAGLARSERVLPMVIAAAGHADVMRRYQEAVDYRRAGGSWGVVARLVGVGASSVVAELAVLERSAPPGQIGDVRQVLAVLAASDLASGALSGAGRGRSGGGGSGSSSSGSSGSGSGGGSGGGPSPAPSPSGPVNQVTGTVQGTVGQVLSILPTPTPTPSGLLPTSITSAVPLHLHP